MRNVAARLGATESGCWDIAGNVTKLRAARDAALSTCSPRDDARAFSFRYPPEDLVLKPKLQKPCVMPPKNWRTHGERRPGILLGTPWRKRQSLQRGLISQRRPYRRKKFLNAIYQLWPFDEKRVFAAAELPDREFRASTWHRHLRRYVDGARHHAFETKGAQVFLVLTQPL